MIFFGIFSLKQNSAVVHWNQFQNLVNTFYNDIHLCCFFVGHLFSLSLLSRNLWHISCRSIPAPPAEHLIVSDFWLLFGICDRMDKTWKHLSKLYFFCQFSHWLNLVVILETFVELTKCIIFAIRIVNQHNLGTWATIFVI